MQLKVIFIHAFIKKYCKLTSVFSRSRKSYLPKVLATHNGAVDHTESSLRSKKKLFGCPPQLFLRRGGRIFFFFFRFFFKSKSKLHRIIASISPNKGANKSTLPKKYLYTSLKPVLKCKQVENNNLKNISKRSKFSKKKKTFFWNSEN